MQSFYWGDAAVASIGVFVGMYVGFAKRSAKVISTPEAIIFAAYSVLVGIMARQGDPYPELGLGAATLGLYILLSRENRLLAVPWIIGGTGLVIAAAFTLAGYHIIGTAVGWITVGVFLAVLAVLIIFTRLRS